MKSRNYRTFELEGKTYQFDVNRFNKAITDYLKRQKEIDDNFKLKNVIEQLADKLNVSEEALKNWRYGHNGPSDIERIKEIADVLQCDYKRLLATRGEKATMTIKNIEYTGATTSDEAVKSIICDLLEVVETFRATRCYKYSLTEFEKVSEGQEAERAGFDGEAEEWFEKIRIKMRKSAFDIKKEDYLKIERLFSETQGFVLMCPTRGVMRWNKICFGFEIIMSIMEEYLWDDLLEMHDIAESKDYLDEDMQKWLREDFYNYLQGEYGYWDNPIDVIGYRIGDWYMRIVRIDFPGLFVD